MAYENAETLVSTDWLAARLDDPSIRILDGSWYLPTMNRDARAEFAEGHIPNARYFDIDAFSDPNSGLPHTVPSAERFANLAGSLGVGDECQVVVYDGAGLFSAARVWWLFRYMGHFNVAVLDGGLPKWKSEGRSLDSATSTVKPGNLTTEPQVGMICDAAAVLDASTSRTARVFDARPAARFSGREPEPRPDLRQGHIPGSTNLPFASFLNPDGTFKSPGDLKALFKEAGLGKHDPAITSCGSGVTASVITLALVVVGHEKHALYDGSWAEWGTPGDLPVAR